MAPAVEPYRQQHAAVSQQQRANPALDPGSAVIDGRDPQQLLDYLRRLAPALRFPTADGRELDWSGLFEVLDGLTGPDGEQLGPDSSQVPPQIALLLAFVELYQQSRRHLNQLGAEHLAFYYRQVLGLQPRPPQPDRVHLLFELARNRQLLQIPAGSAALAGELQYLLGDELFADHAGIERLHSVFRDPIDGRLRYALASNSADGLGAVLEPEGSSWPAFGDRQLPLMPVGFALAGPVLMLAEGKRSIELRLDLDIDSDNVGRTASGGSLVAGLTIEFSGEENWIGPLKPSAASLRAAHGGGRTLVVKVELGEDQAPVSLYDPTKLVGGFAVSAPVMKVQLLGDADPAIAATLAAARVRAMSINVVVEGVSQLQLENDLGRLNVDKPFMPFGPQPAVGSSFYIGSPETFAKRLDSYSLQLKWQDVPPNLSEHYRAYLHDKQGLKTVAIDETAVGVTENRQVPDNGHFKARMRLIRAGSSDAGVSVELFDGSNATLPHEVNSDPAAPLGLSIQNVVLKGLFTRQVKSAQVQFPLVRTTLVRPLVGGSQPAALTFLPDLASFALPRARRSLSLRHQRRLGYIQLSLESSFLHREFPYLFSATTIDDKSTLTPNPPYTPVLESIRMDYRAHSGRVEPGSTSEQDYQAKTLQLFHLTPFGQAEEHGFLKQGLAHVSDTRARLLPSFIDEGSLLLGLRQARPGTDLNLLVQVAEGSANPLKSRRQVHWSLLSGNHWRPFAQDEIRREQTNQLLRSGLVTLRLPSAPLATNTALDPTLTWVRASIDTDTDAVCRFVGLHTQAAGAELSPADTATDPAHLGSALAADSITKLRRQQSGIKAVSQPYASFGGSPAESDACYRQRVAERLRHRHRAVSRWDYERLVLQHFPQLHSVKVLSHTRPAAVGSPAVAGSAQAPGHVTVITVPDLRNRNAYDPLQPRTDLDTLSAIDDLLTELSVPGIQVHAANPSYERIQLNLSVRMGAAYPFGRYRDILNQDLQRRLSPWAFDDALAPGFGGRLHRSELLAFVAGLEYIDRVERIALYHLSGDDAVAKDRSEVVASSAASILVSHPRHLIQDASLED